LAKAFGTLNIRIFSFYPAADAPEADWPKHRDDVLKRLGEMVERAETAAVRLLHENEHRIYGDSPDRVADLLDQIQSPALGAVYDPANYVFCGYDPIVGWEKTKHRTVHFHIKDWVHGEDHGQVAGEGHGRIADVLADAVNRTYDGFATLEPHLLGGGPTGGVTGPDLFPKAVEALRGIMRRVGAEESI
jgi:sugar phosphate isomerase/epimerase